jgi:uncharacterized FlaG/YvyC family protein
MDITIQVTMNINNIVNKVSSIPSKIEKVASKQDSLDLSLNTYQQQDNKNTQNEPKEVNVLQKSFVNTQTDPEKLLEDMNKALKDKNIEAVYLKDEETGKTVLQLKDMTNNEVIKQIPSEKMLAVSQEITKFLDTYNKKGSQPTDSLSIIEDWA